jgi:hypothetical protein
MKLCKPVVLTSKGILVPFLREHFLASDPPHQVLATSFEFRRGEGVDVLALAPEGRLVAVLAHLDEPVAILDDILRRLHWMIENAPLVQRLFPTANIDQTRPPRLVLAVPRLAERLRDVLRYFTATELAVYEYHLVEIEGEIALLMEEAGRFPYVAVEEPALAAVLPQAPTEEAEAALDEVVTRQETVPASLADDPNVEIHVDDMNVAELGVSEQELLELLNIHVPGRDPQAPSA